jgi:hypothetical protein
MGIEGVKSWLSLRVRTKTSFHCQLGTSVYSTVDWPDKPECDTIVRTVFAFACIRSDLAPLKRGGSEMRRLSTCSKTTPCFYGCFASDSCAKVRSY